MLQSSLSANKDKADARESTGGCKDDQWTPGRRKAESGQTNHLQAVQPSPVATPLGHDSF